MSHPTDEEIAEQLIALISDGFNRSMGELVKAGAIDTAKLHEQYKGVGSKFYDLVTEQITLTAKHGTPCIRRLFSHDGSSNQNP
jgi:hypothetical protein